MSRKDFGPKYIMKLGRVSVALPLFKGVNKMTTTNIERMQRNANLNIMYKEMNPECKTDNRPYIFLANGKMVRSYRFTYKQKYITISTYDMSSLPLDCILEILEDLRS